ncbi:zinc finger CCCH-type with G patch domain-containing protein [Hemiscyllium ocellatum]|uniref:zinc finger CCCH-type with G patch domain-containing protein n=1 Tax=Hemiscyllium ocellatum TaxID=170820 RepID=UPI0029662F90|nr:zinc finger CCCH-type with G patch domain-containing protein [Hemiscyllium ocellatum]
MDEASLEAAIEVYKAQLQQVEAALGSGAQADAQADLLQLQADLQQLVALTESSLLSVRKSQLLEQLQRGASSPEPEAQPGLDAEYAAFQAALGEAEGSREPGSGDEAEAEAEAGEMSGAKVRAPYRPAWGPVQYHNAMVVGVEADQPPEPTVRVLWIHPTQRAMKPCPFYLSGSCRFLDSCRYSHGEVVAVSELREFEELDLSPLEVGSACLAKYEDEIWYPAKILDIDNGYFTVKFDSLLQKEIVVEGDGIMPIPQADESSSSSSEDEGELGYAKVLDEKSVSWGNWSPACSSSFAGWEAHTRGIGSKLMVKLGYEFGKGLGKNADGRVEPVQAVVLPPGKSLDQCAEILQKKREGKLNHLHKKKHKRKSEGGSHVVKERKPCQTVFDFLNDKLQSTGQTSSSPIPTGFPMREKSSKERYRGTKSTKKALNIHLFQITEKIEHTEKDIAKIMEALARNVGRDKAVTTHLEEKLSNAKKQLSYLKSQESGAQQEQRKADTHKKMTKF